MNDERRLVGRRWQVGRMSARRDLRSWSVIVSETISGTMRFERRAGKYESNEVALGVRFAGGRRNSATRLRWSWRVPTVPKARVVF